jgi:hypothetical protein
VSSIEFAHEPDPLNPSVDGDAKERAPDDNEGLTYEGANTEAICLCAGMSISADEVSQTGALENDGQAEMISPGQFSRPRKSKSARIDDTTPMAMAATDVVLSDDVTISQAGPEK